MTQFSSGDESWICYDFVCDKLDIVFDDSQMQDKHGPQMTQFSSGDESMICYDFPPFGERWLRPDISKNEKSSGPQMTQFSSSDESWICYDFVCDKLDIVFDDSQIRQSRV
jgi:hypothetical protein